MANRFFWQAHPNVRFLMTFLQSTLISQEEGSIVSWLGVGEGGHISHPQTCGKEEYHPYTPNQLSFVKVLLIHFSKSRIMTYACSNTRVCLFI